MSHPEIARLLTAVVLTTACNSPTAPIPCTVARATEVDTLGWSIRANGDTVGPILAWTCDPRIHFATVAALTGDDK